MVPVIICATLSKSANTCKIVLENGFDPNVTTDGINILRLCSNAAMPALLTTDNNYTALICSTILGNIDICNILIQHKADINAKTDDGFTALIYAALVNNYEVCSLLLSHNANVDTSTKDGHTALSYAALNGNTKMCEAILKKNKECKHTTIPHNTLAIVAMEPISCRDHVLKILYDNKNYALSVKSIHALLPDNAKKKYSVQNISTIIFHLKREGKVESILQGKSYTWHIKAH